ncbi:AzlC family ABC transporter permease [Ferruginivarius sediminum]|uniref:Branched-chain amino acid ABC transporter permease n=1 Tax=Ferruginivarius sediminum TaxID=2661937 RepID=A0A369TAS2_9PROT|nr:AzlC family ABC transporter permease [Ferruginivarius sediminum]RDD61475.1 branched-chain amino acid ABC transporter permease [Ferruginivarius sediminum]
MNRASSNTTISGNRRQRPVFKGIREAVGVPAIVMCASFVGFGALVRHAGLSVWHGMLSTATGWGLPGQIALVEMYAAGASLFAISLAVAMAQARLLPMTITLMPVLNTGKTPRWQPFAAAHLVAVTGWAVAMRECPDMPGESRMPYYFAFAGTLWVLTIVATAAGYALAGAVPAMVNLGLVFLNPLYFMLLFVGDVRRRARALSLGFGAVCGPLMHLASPDWGLLATGLIAGTAVYVADRQLGARRRA